MSSWAGVAVAATTTGYALVSRRLVSLLVSAPMAFVGVGLALGPLGFDVISLQTDHASVLVLLELTLVLVLFTDAMSVRADQLHRDDFLPGRLLGIGFPITMGLGWLLAWPLLPGLGIWELALVGIILAPTDAALGLAAIGNPGVPTLVREGLNVESGLNDGLSLPFFVLALAAAVPSAEGGHGPLGIFVRALVISTAIGAVVGVLGGLFLLAARAREWIEDTWQQLFLVAVAILSYTLAVVVDGSGFIAAWVAGLGFAGAVRRRAGAETPVVDSTAAFAGSLATVLTSLSFLAFGAVLLGPALQHLDWRVVAYSLLSLTVIRMLPVTLSLVGSRLKAPTQAYIGWFGPRGLASIVLGLLVAETASPGVRLVGDVIAVTVGISVVVHGVSARPLAASYARWYAQATAVTGDLREATPADIAENRGTFVPGQSGAAERDRGPIRSAFTGTRKRGR